jgi:hypothetical protein
MRLTNLCVSEPFFDCELGTFIQEEGAPMGGPLSGLLADLIIENKIEKPIATHPRWGKLVDWIRKADDTFLEWTSTPHDLHEFHQFLNSLHPTIKWTMELEKDNRIPFLDVLIIKSPPQLLTTVYRKCSASNRYIHFTSSQPWSEKSAALKTLRRRAEDYRAPLLNYWKKSCYFSHKYSSRMVSLPKPYIASSTNNLHPHPPSQIKLQALKNPPNPPSPSLPHFTPPPEDCSKPYRPNLTSPPSTQKPQLLATSSLKDAQTALSTHQALSMPSLVNVLSFTYR